MYPFLVYLVVLTCGLSVFGSFDFVFVLCLFSLFVVCVGSVSWGKIVVILRMVVSLS